MFYVRVFHLGSAGWKHSLMFCLAVRFVSQLCRIPLGTFRLHHGNGLVSPNGLVREGGGYCRNSSPSAEIAAVILLTYLSCGGHSSLRLEVSCNPQQAAMRHGALSGSTICSLLLLLQPLATRHPGHWWRFARSRRLLCWLLLWHWSPQADTRWPARTPCPCHSSPHWTRSPALTSAGFCCNW